jgi:hypothetical protein
VNSSFEHLIASISGPYLNLSNHTKNLEARETGSLISDFTQVAK